MIKQLGFLILVQFLVVDASPKDGQKLSDYLWEQTAAYQQQALNSSLIYGMRARCLDPSEFGGYMLDDTLYCYETSLSLKKAGDRSNDNTTLKEHMESTADSWEEYWEWLKDIWHVENAGGIKMGEAGQAYVDHIRNVSEHESPVYTILALTPCAKLWPWLGKQIGSGSNDFGVYTSWVEENLVPTSTGYMEYQDHVEWAYEAGVVTAEKALEIFTASIQNEVNFFNSVARCQPRPRRESGNDCQGEA
ncbi:uncharacterized protein LOC134815194 [Bolinopsis microptera]|uniref:uncharacterized protein LOC134815194 n=1 Tax=Bolinopsis microptera TaxID=2820187 RepID=UPI0030796CB0